MALYFIEYDLRKKRDYQKLYDQLNEFNALQILESTWCFNRINTTAGKLRDYLSQYIDSDDGLLVAEVTDWATFNTNGNPNQLK